MPDRAPADYSEQPGCHDCAAVFRKYDHDECNTYFCCEGAPDRPPCGSVAMGEDFWTTRDINRLFDKDPPKVRAWDDWSGGRRVAPWGICGRWKPED